MTFIRSWRRNMSYTQTSKWYRNQRYRFQKRKTRYAYKKPDIASQALWLAKKARKQSSPEIKSTDLSITNVSSSFGTVLQYCLSGVVQGTGPFDRAGNQIFMKDVLVRMNINQNVSITDTTTTRVIMFVDKQANGTTPTIADLIKSTTNNIFGPLQRDYRDRFLILYDRFINTNNTDYTGITETIYRKLNMIETFKGTTADESDIATNAVWIYLWGDTAIDLSTIISLYTRVKYTDC